MAQPYPTEFSPEIGFAAIAASRFGYGARPGQLSAISADPAGWVMSQISGPPEPSPGLDALPGSPAKAAALIDSLASGPGAVRAHRRAVQAAFEREAQTHMAHTLASKTPVRERLVRFWCNFFGITATDPRSMSLAYAFEREVVRPHMTGSYTKLLTQAVRHPAMLLAFENSGSFGQYSPAGLGSGSGLNAALAHHIITRLTVADETAHTDRDIVELTKMLTGWSVAGPAEPNAGTFVFREELHQPQGKFFLNRAYPSAGALEAEAALDALTRREPTARNLATRLARNILSDAPAEDVVDSMIDGYAGGGNSLRGLVQGLVDAPGAWTPVQAKAKSPEDLVLSVARALDYGPDRAGVALRSMRALGQAPKQAPLVAGWPDLDAAWTAPQQVVERAQWVAAAAAEGIQALGTTPVPDFALSILGPLVSAQTYRRLSVTRDRAEALGLLFASPEFQRR